MVYTFGKVSLRGKGFPSMLPSFPSCWLECRFDGWMPDNVRKCAKEAKQLSVTQWRRAIPPALDTRERNNLGSFSSDFYLGFRKMNLLLRNTGAQGSLPWSCQLQIKVLICLFQCESLDSTGKTKWKDKTQGIQPQVTSWPDPQLSWTKTGLVWNKPSSHEIPSGWLYR